MSAAGKVITGNQLLSPLTEEEMIDDVEEWISRDGFELDKTVCQVSSSEPRTYFYNLGLTVGTIDQGLRYAH